MAGIENMADSLWSGLDKSCCLCSFETSSAAARYIRSSDNSTDSMSRQHMHSAYATKQSLFNNTINLDSINLYSRAFSSLTRQIHS